MLPNRFLALCATAMLCACGGNPLQFDESTPFGPISSDEAAGVAASYDSLSEQVLAIAPTSTFGMDTSGRATFSGMATLTVSEDATSDSMALVGEASVIADFGGRSVTATMFNFAGADMAGAGQRLDGSLTMANGVIGATAPNGLSGTFRGTLVADDYTIVADGTMAGTFRGTPTVAVSFTGQDDTALMDGDLVRLRLSGVAQE